MLADTCILYDSLKRPNNGYVEISLLPYFLAILKFDFEEL